MRETMASVSPDVEGTMPTAVPETRRSPDAHPSRDLVDTLCVPKTSSGDLCWRISLFPLENSLFLQNFSLLI
jgi:hypothetical protein